MLLANSNENNNGCFDSSECTTSANRPYVVMTYDDNTSTPPESGNGSFATATAMTPGTNYQVNITSAGGKKYFKFTPDETGFYTFKSNAPSGINPLAWLYNRNCMKMTGDDDSEDGRNFRLTYHLKEGITYYYTTELSENATGNYSVSIYKTGNGGYIDSNVLFSKTQVSAAINMVDKVNVYKIIPSYTGEYLFFCSNFQNSNPTIRIYNSAMVCNEEDDIITGKTMYKDNTYYVVIEGIGPYILNSLEEATFSEKDLHIKNIGTGWSIRLTDNKESVYQGELILDYKNSITNAEIKCNSNWKVKRQGEYYTIMSGCNDDFLGIDSTNQSIKLYGSTSSYTEWKIYYVGDEQIIIIPRNLSAMVLCPVNESEGSALGLRSTSSMNVNCKWKYNNTSYYANRAMDIINLELANDQAKSDAWRPIIENAANAWRETVINPEINVGTYFEPEEKWNTCLVYVGGYGNTTWTGVVKYDTMFPTMQINRDLLLDKNGIYKLSVVTHEIGHLFGLGDNPTTSNTSLMNHTRDKVLIYTPLLFDINNVLFLR